MKIDTNIVKSLGEYTDCMCSIARRYADCMYKSDSQKRMREQNPPVLWFRGLSDINHSLAPSIFRQNTYVTREKDGGDYSALHFAEDIRTQHYIAKNYHFFQKEPSSRVEWLEVMQHHETRTRVLDWSESSIHSLLFAIEPFLDDKRYKEQQREQCVPCVWVLEPGKLNKAILSYLKNLVREKTFIEELLNELMLDGDEKKQIFDNMERMSDCMYHETNETWHINYIFNLSAINDEILRDRTRIKYLLMQGDIINPFHYILSRIYSDGHILKKRELPPLAVVHPYHSERIKAQKGVFTVFPFYEEQEFDSSVRKMGINPDAMDNNAMAKVCLHKIVLNDPQNIAYEVLANGMNISWLYPEMPIVSSEIEGHQVYS